MWQAERASSPYEASAWLFLAGLPSSPPALAGGVGPWVWRQRPAQSSPAATWRRVAQSLVQSQIALGGVALAGLGLWLVCLGLWLPLLGLFWRALLTASLAGSLWPLLGLWAWGLLLTPA